MSHVIPFSSVSGLTNSLRNRMAHTIIDHWNREFIKTSYVVIDVSLADEFFPIVPNLIQISHSQRKIYCAPKVFDWLVKQLNIIPLKYYSFSVPRALVLELIHQYGD